MAHILPCFLCVKYNIANNALPLCLDSHNPSSLTNQVNSITNRFEIKYIVTFHSIPGTVYPLQFTPVFLSDHSECHAHIGDCSL